MANKDDAYSSYTSSSKQSKTTMKEGEAAAVAVPNNTIKGPGIPTPDGVGDYNLDYQS